jgi:hypothetical protein
MEYLVRKQTLLVAIGHLYIRLVPCLYLRPHIISPLLTKFSFRSITYLIHKVPYLNNHQESCWYDSMLKKGKWKYPTFPSLSGSCMARQYAARVTQYLTPQQ